jgi:hypothetical protein
MSDPIETGDIYFFYRPKVDVDRPQAIDDVQRFYLVMVPDEGAKSRLFVVGKKRLPEIHPGQSKSREREWMMTTLASTPEKIGEELGPVVYETKTKGTRKQSEAIPAGAGRYALIEADGSTRLAYRLTAPDKPREVQKEFGIESEASYVISVRNPAIDVPGFPDPKPDYPKKLREKFADERWIDISDPKLLEYENAQLVLIGAEKSVEGMKGKMTGKSDLFGKLGLDKSAWPADALDKGQWASPEYETEAKAPRGDRTKGGERGGRRAVGSPSAAGIAKALKGIHFPNDSAELVSYAKKHHANEEILDVLEHLPRRKYSTMADVEKALSQIR